MDQKPIKLAVISDQHIDTETEPESWDLAREVYKAVARAKPDHVIIAGDTFDCATAMERDRELVSRYLRKLGLWERDRLTVVVGNHDIFHVAGRGSRAHQIAEFSKAAWSDAQGHYEAFCEWAGEVADADDSLDDDDDLFPIEKKLEHVRLYAMDTTEVESAFSGYGWWPEEDDDFVRENEEEGEEKRVLAIHNAPFSSRKYGKSDLARMVLSGDYLPLGYPPSTLKRLERFVSDLLIDSVVCGHLHDPGDEEYDWEIGDDDWTADVHLVGRSGGVDETNPCFGVLDVPVNGALRWKVVRV